MYKSILGIRQTQTAIKSCKDYFERELANSLNLTRVSAPLFVTPESGLNDALNGTERPVQFDILETGKDVQIVQSLAKWKRYALGKYGFEPGEGLYTDMNAIRRDETTDALHSLLYFRLSLSTASSGYNAESSNRPPPPGGNRR